MILVLLGTFPTAFKRPLLEIEKLCEDGTISEEIIVQNGYTAIESKYQILRPFIAPDELAALYNKARVIITHAGTGSIIKGLKLHKKVIAIPRLSKYGEVVDDHQLEILNEFAKMNYIMPWYENVQLKSILSVVDDFTPSPYISNKEKIISYLTDYVDSL